MNLDDLKFVRLVESGRKPHYVFEQDKDFYVFTLQDYETRGDFYVLSKIEVEKVKKELLQRSIPNPFNTSEIYKLINEVTSDYLKENYSTTSDEYIGYYTHRLTNICYVLEALKILSSVKEGHKTYFYKDCTSPYRKIPEKNIKIKEDKPRQTIAQKVENLTKENLQKERLQNSKKSPNRENNKPETKAKLRVDQPLTSSEIIQQKFDEIEKNKNHGLPPKRMYYNNFIRDPDTEQNNLFSDFRKIGNRVKTQYSRAQFHSLINHYGITKVKQAILHDISKIRKNHGKVKLKIPSMIENSPNKN